MQQIYKVCVQSLYMVLDFTNAEVSTYAAIRSPGSVFSELEMRKLVKKMLWYTYTPEHEGHEQI